MPLIPSAPEPTGKLPPQDWIKAVETQSVINALQADGAAVRFVGGCVRDALAKRPVVVNDIDIATPDPPEIVIGLLERAEIKAVPTSIEHGTVTAIVDRKNFQIATLRRDVETNGRHAKVAFTDDWVVDASRRDFTVNTMSASPEGDVYDPYDGISDLADGRIRFVGLAQDRVDEDVLRILRFFRFQGAYGRPPANRDALAACRSRAEKLVQLSGERVRDELFRILLTPYPADVVLMMRGERVIEHILPELGDINRLRMLNWLETRAIVIPTVSPDALRRLASLIDTNAAGAETISARLRLSNAYRERLAGLVSPAVDIDADMGDAAGKRAIRRLGVNRVCDLCLLAWAKELALKPRLPSERTEGWIAILKHADQWSAPAFPLSGNDVTALGITEGRRVGVLLSRVEDWWETGNYRAPRQACLERLYKLIDGDS